MIKIKKEITGYQESCKICKKPIIGTSKSQVIYNMKKHIKFKHEGYNYVEIKKGIEDDL